MDEDRIIEKLVEIEAEIKTLPRRDEFDTFKNQVFTLFDQQSVILNRLDQ